MGFGINIKNSNNNRFVCLNRVLVFILILLNVYYCSTIAEGKQSDASNGSKKKVVIVGEMSDLYANESQRTELGVYQHDYDYTDDPNHNRIRRGKPIPIKQLKPQYVRRKTPGPGAMFVPVAAYSITKSKNKPYRSSNGYRKRQGGPIRRNPDLGNKHTESAVYGYMQRPEIIEFRGQYFYGDPPRPGDPLDASGSNVDGIRYSPLDRDPIGAHSDHYQPYYNGGNKIKGTGGIGPGGLLLATLPLILAPMLSYLFTPMIIPITATVAAGRRKRDIFDDSLKVMTFNNIESVNPKVLKDGSFGAKSSSNSQIYSGNEWMSSSDRLNDSKYKEAQVVVEYLRKVHFDEKATTRAIANYLQCDGMLADEDHCIERLSCEFSDPNNSGAPELDRAVTSIILGHILANEYITDSFKLKIKIAAVYGKDNPGLCTKFHCIKVQVANNM